MSKGTKQLFANHNRDADMLQSGNDDGEPLHKIKTTYVLHQWCTTARLRALMVTSALIQRPIIACNKFLGMIVPGEIAGTRKVQREVILGGGVSWVHISKEGGCHAIVVASILTQAGVGIQGVHSHSGHRGVIGWQRDACL